MTTVYVGDASIDFAQKITSLHSDAILLTSANFQSWPTHDYVYTSVADLETDEFLDLCTHAARVIYIELSDRQLYYSTNQLLLGVTATRPVENFAVAPKYDKYLYLDDYRKTEEPQLWCAGCSFTYGEYVREDQRYPTLLAAALGRQLSLLAKPARSILWAADQLLRSDIRSGDIVVWGLTTHHRMPYWQDKEHHMIANGSSFPVSVSRLVEEDVVCRNIKAIAQVINFCKKAKANLYLLGLLDVGYHTTQWFDTEHYIPFFKKSLDFGSDGVHPGPLQHQHYAEVTLQKIRETT